MGAGHALRAARFELSIKYPASKIEHQLAGIKDLI
jgi:hypothetical protein